MKPYAWDRETDVIVLGFGGAGVAAAVTAHDQGAEVLILEKAPEGLHGGNTRIAAQGYLNTSDADKAATYLEALCGPYPVPDDMIRTWA
ncbi:MAG TPA: FAD-binding dehydrogenase, partial [Rhodospirillaceae bacterium]|nr:FAD-binding dehydrogenase [Rhodospirillaceae bacterium]